MTGARAERPRAVVTGATSGIGEAYARALASRGYDLLLTGRRRHLIDQVARELEETCRIQAEVITVELSDADALSTLVEKIGAGGPIDVLVNNAGFTTKGLYHAEDIAEQENMVRVHALAMMRLTHAVLPGMIERGSGAIINVASLQAVTPMAGSTTYSSVKAFMKNFSLCLHGEVRASGVKVQCLLPGFTRTDLGRTIGVDMNAIADRGMMRWMSPAEVVRVSLRDLEKNRVISIPGAGNRLLYAVAKALPDRLWLALAPSLAKKMP
jgi:short-subunit dehydrogenase